MRQLAPFERRPHLAVAVSGGPDSMALALLLQDWVAARDGRLTALTVDHGLRPEAAQEADTVAAWLAARGIAHQTLVWRPGETRSNLQARARAARYGLLEDWSARSGVLHLCVAHQREDQAETILLRLGRGSGVDGLAAMAPSSERTMVRLLRPLLTVPRARLIACCAAAGQPFILDPSNRDPAYARARLRRALPSLGPDGLTVDRLAGTAARMQRARTALEAATMALLAQAARPHPAGLTRLSLRALRAAPEEIALRALSAVLRRTGDGVHPARGERLEGLWQSLCRPGFEGRTLGGCRILPVAGGRQEVLILRELAACPPPRPLSPGGIVRWDRFLVAAPDALPAACSVGALGVRGLRALRGENHAFAETALPRRALPCLPAVHDLDGILAVPHLSYCRSGRWADTMASLVILLDSVFLGGRTPGPPPD